MPGTVLADRANMAYTTSLATHLTKPIKKEVLLDTIGEYTHAGQAGNKGLRDGDHTGKPRPRIVTQVDPDIADMIPGYLANLKRDLAAIHQALEANDLTTILTLAHRLKGSGGGYGFKVLSEIGDLMETAAREGRTGDIQIQVTRLADYLDRVEIADA